MPSGGSRDRDEGSFLQRAVLASEMPLVRSQGQSTWPETGLLEEAELARRLSQSSHILLFTTDGLESSWGLVP